MLGLRFLVFSHCVDVIWCAAGAPVGWSRCAVDRNVPPDGEEESKGEQQPFPSHDLRLGGCGFRCSLHSLSPEHRWPRSAELSQDFLKSFVCHHSPSATWSLVGQRRKLLLHYLQLWSL